MRIYRSSLRGQALKAYADGLLIRELRTVRALEAVCAIIAYLFAVVPGAAYREIGDRRRTDSESSIALL